MTDVTRLISQIESGDREASDRLLPLVYDELRQLAAAALAREKPGQTIQATALVHDAYLKLVGREADKSWENRRHFFGAAAKSMRRILVDRARQKRRQKRGGGRERVEFELVEATAPAPGADLVELDEALQILELEHPRIAKLVELRFFAGLTNKQASQALGISTSTADNDWAYARSWLRVALTNDD